ncbi:LLM class flavin-dependent oxidoreductase [SAR202 cluster bacterium AD-804-J14_MRT_500m]|nr:LLM class flavin-dependent oxidoreductase [SAR202 cluster bacterium AD-804-J14_MRT_500m]
MKFCWFHLMPYRFLPPDFEKKYHSVWVDVPSTLFDPVKGHQLYNEYMDQLEFAEQMGYDGICVNEHHNNAYGLMPSPNIIAAALTRRTSEAALIVLGNSIALYNPPLRVAEEFAMLDCISGGRLIAGFPVGTSQDTNFAYGQIPATLREKYYEAHDLIKRAWTDPEPFAFNGKYTQNRYVNIWPRPLQQPHPPVWIPGGGSVETWGWTIEQNYVYCYLSYSGYQLGSQLMAGYWEEVDRRGAEPNPYRAGFLQLVAVSETDEQVDEYAPYIEYFYKKCLHVPGYFADAPGYRTVKSVQSAVGASTLAVRRQQAEGFTWKDYITNGNVIAGSPATVRDRMREAIKSLGVGHLMVLCQFGDMPKNLALKNTELFAKEVMPHLRDIWPDWEDHWWPSPLSLSERTQPRSIP